MSLRVMTVTDDDDIIAGQLVRRKEFEYCHCLSRHQFLTTDG